MKRGIFISCVLLLSGCADVTQQTFDRLQEKYGPKSGGEQYCATSLLWNLPVRKEYGTYGLFAGVCSQHPITQQSIDNFSADQLHNTVRVFVKGRF